MEAQGQKDHKYNRNTELRHLEPKDIYDLSFILDENDCWKKLMEKIPKKIDAQRASADGQLKWNEAIKSGFKYNNDHIKIIEKATKRSSDRAKLFSQTLIDEWSTSGRKNERPTVGVLLQLLVEANLFRAADFVAVDILGEPRPQRPLEGPARRISISLPDEGFDHLIDMVNDSEFYPDTEDLNEINQTSNLKNDNNKDYYTKYKNTNKEVNLQNEHAVPIPPPRIRRLYSRPLLEQNESENKSETAKEVTNGTLDTSATSRKPTIESKMGNNSITRGNSLKVSEPLMQLEPASIINSNNTQSDSNKKSTNPESTHLSEAIIPNLSIFENPTQKSEEQNEPNSNAPLAITSSCDFNTTLPNISALNLNDENKSGGNLDECSDTSDSVKSSNALSKESSLEEEDISFANDCKDDNDYDNSLPNLSIFGERSSNNDSSLTNVTGTSGENSFELSTNESISSVSNDDNIPCLTALNQ